MPTKPVVIIVEDDAITARFLSEIASDAGWMVQVTSTCAGAKAKSAALVESSAIWLIDCALPDGQGDALWTELRSMGSDIAWMALAMSADLNPGKQTQLKSAGFFGCVLKPLSRSELLRILDDAALYLSNNESKTAPNSCPATTSPVIESNHLLVLDDKDALQRCGQVVVLNGLRAMLKAELPQTLAAVKQAVTANDREALCAILHKSKASARFCGALSFQSACENLHQAALSDLEDLNSQFQVWEADCLRLLDALNQIS